MKTRQILIITLLSILFGIGIMYARGTKKEARHVQNEQELQQRRERSRSVYRGARNPHSEKIPDVAAIAKGDVRIEREVGLPILTPNPAVRFDLQEFLTSRACDADSIVVATATSGTSQLTDDQSFLFTNYELRVESVLKDNSAQSVKMGQVITVIRTGGKKNWWENPIAWQECRRGVQSSQVVGSRGAVPAVLELSSGEGRVRS